MTKRRIILIAAVIAVLVAAAAAGAYLYMNRFDAGEYVQAVLDVSYKNKTDKYVEITGVSEKEAEKIFEDNLDATMKGFETSDMPTSFCRNTGSCSVSWRKTSVILWESRCVERTAFTV